MRPGLVLATMMLRIGMISSLPTLGDMSTKYSDCVIGAYPREVNDPQWLTEREARAWRGYRRMRLLLNLRLARDLARDTGLSEADYDVLSTLSETPGHRLRLGDLAAYMGWSKSRLSHHVSRMQNRGLVRREEAPGDGRGSVVVLSPAGLRAIEAAAPFHVASVRQHLVDLLTEDEIAVLDAVTHRVVERLGADPGAEYGDHRQGEATGAPGDRPPPSRAPASPAIG
jgi:DNA-binding MarR family transcriptional regulator